MGENNAGTKVTRGYVLATSWAGLWGVAIIIFVIVMAVVDRSSNLLDKLLGVGSGAVIGAIPILAAIGAITEFVKQRRKP